MGGALDLDQACSRAVDWSREAGEIAVRRFGGARASRKADQSVVTDADLEIQDLILKRIHACYPDHAIIAEENTPQAAGASLAGACWLIDPIDGTRNYARGFPVFCTSIALLDHGAPVVGVIYEPLSGRVYRGVAGGGALLDDQPLQCRGAGEGAEWIIGIPTPKHRPLPEAIREDWPRRAVLRNTGSTALHLALVASAALDAAYGQEVRLWDIAAGAVLVAEAGGRLTGPNGAALFPVEPAFDAGTDLAFLAANAPVHEALLGTLG